MNKEQTAMQAQIDALLNQQYLYNYGLILTAQIKSLNLPKRSGKSKGNFSIVNVSRALGLNHKRTADIFGPKRKAANMARWIAEAEKQYNAANPGTWRPIEEMRLQGYKATKSLIKISTQQNNLTMEEKTVLQWFEIHKSL